ncbi:malonyl- mitochondrial [Brachionus plicatilis]|uniref:Malonyl-mitochondrial n=1 Tax=Brachionus plicatilis TaxID=10195 RepID=A0A3M7QI83_BRAPC|nr:malonyl- mitochondrial [Brachionus plicatilis]
MPSWKNLRSTVKEIIDLGSKSATLADPKSSLFCQQFLNQAPRDRSELIKFICLDHGLKTDQIFNSINFLTNSSKNLNDFSKNFRLGNYDKLSTSIRPEYYNLFQNLARVKEGVSTLVKLRADLLKILEQKYELNTKIEEDLKIMNFILKNMLVLWFSTGLLNIQRIDWKSPTILVEKVAQYESVHQIKTLTDLKNRLGSTRRCFIYTHSTMPYEPLVILHIALTNSVSSNISDLIKRYKTAANEENKEFDATKCTNAIFYSINSCQKGLQQVDLGNSLIKSCVRLLLEELPNLKNFHTLSPIPRFKEWLDLKIALRIENKSDIFQMDKCFKQDEIDFLNEHFKTNDFTQLIYQIKDYINSSKFKKVVEDFDSEINDFKTKANDYRLDSIMVGFLIKACSFYLFFEKKNGYAFNSVTNFHIKNGAQIYRLNFGADQSDNGWRSSYSMMVNYGYNLNDLDYNCVNYLTTKSIKISELFEKNLINFSQSKI